MKQTILPLFLLLALTACQERNTVTAPVPAQAEKIDIPSIATPIQAEKIETPSLPVTKKPQEAIIEKITPPIIDSPIVEKPTIPVVKKPKIVPNTQVKRKTHVKSKTEVFSGGTITDGLDIGIIRLGKEGTTTRLVFDSFKWNIDTKTPSVRSHESGYYTFTYNPQNRRITAVVDGYRGFSALRPGKERLFKSSKMVKKIYLEKYFDDSGYKFTIELKQNAKVNVFDLKAPGRIIVDISPI